MVDDRVPHFDLEEGAIEKGSQKVTRSQIGLL
jgi:hypothetical protein